MSSQPPPAQDRSETFDRTLPSLDEVLNARGEIAEPTNNKPIAMVGAGQLAAAVWATTDARGARRHSFNVFRIDASTGCVTQRFTDADVADLAKLAEVLTVAMTE